LTIAVTYFIYFLKTTPVLHPSVNKVADTYGSIVMMQRSGTL